MKTNIYFLSLGLILSLFTSEISFAISKNKLSQAVRNQDYEGVKELLKSGMDPNIKDSLGNTPLHLAGKDGLGWIGELLIKFGADLSIKNNKGKTADQLAFDNGYLETAHWLQKNRGKANRAKKKVKLLIPERKIQPKLKVPSPVIFHNGKIKRIDHMGAWKGTKNQQATGTCHAFGAIALVEAAYFKKYGTHKNLSEAHFVQEWMHNNLKFDFQKDLDYIIDNGVCNESLWNFDFALGNKNEKIYNKLAFASGKKKKKYMDMNCPIDFKKVQVNKKENKEFVSQLKVTIKGDLNSKDLIDHLTCNPVGVTVNNGAHVVVIAGYDKASDSFIIRNSGYRGYYNSYTGEYSRARTLKVPGGKYDLVSRKTLMSSVGDATIVHFKGDKLRGCIQ